MRRLEASGRAALTRARQGVGRAALLAGCAVALLLLLAVDYARSLWELLDLATVVVPLVSLLPWVSDELRSTPILRLARLLRAAAFETRAGGAVVRAPEARRAVVEPAPLGVALITEEDPTPKHAEWDDFLKALLGATDTWYHLSGGTAAEVRQLARVIYESGSLAA